MYGITHIGHGTLRMAHVGHGALIGRGIYGGKVSLTHESSLNQYLERFILTKFRRVGGIVG